MKSLLDSPKPSTGSRGRHSWSRKIICTDSLAVPQSHLLSAVLCMATGNCLFYAVAMVGVPM